MPATASKLAARPAWSIAAVAATLVGGYLLAGRHPCARWGASAEEAAAPMPGDEFLPRPGLLTTRAVTIATEPTAVWPWLVQMGPGRAGAYTYTYDWIENLFGLDMHSTREILPAYQHLAVGDEIALGASGPTMRARIVEPQRALVWVSDNNDWVWSFLLTPTAHGTRLISRNRSPRSAIAAGAAPLRRGHGARESDHGAKDAAWHQATRREARAVRPRPTMMMCGQSRTPSRPGSDSAS